MTFDLDDITCDLFEACQAGKGWPIWRNYCHPQAIFRCQAGPLSHLTTVKEYCHWVMNLHRAMPDITYSLRTIGHDPTADIVTAFAQFEGTHTGEGGPVPPTNKRVEVDFVYIISFGGGKIFHMTKVWNAEWAYRKLGWA